MIRRRTGRRAYTLLELVVATGSSVIILGGLASALSISTHVLGPVVSAHDDGNRAAIVLSQLTADLRLAKRFTERTNRAVTFITPDRDGDGVDETIRYWWSGAVGDPLQYRYNGGPTVSLLQNVQAFSITALLRTIAADLY